jgi:GrpB-like predicted nucleotidyltransferase (UPF0157 family)
MGSRPPGWVDEPVRLSAYDPNWPLLFEAEKVLLEGALGEVISGGVHHIGSTAVVGMTGKPVIDILVGVKSLDAARAHFAKLEELQYCYSPFRPWEHWFCKPSPECRTHHLHLIEPTHPDFQRVLRFRDRLRSDPQVRRDYVALKQSLASRYAHDREAYTDGKAEFVHRYSQGVE